MATAQKLRSPLLNKEIIINKMTTTVLEFPTCSTIALLINFFLFFSIALYKTVTKLAKFDREGAKIKIIND